MQSFPDVVRLQVGECKYTTTLSTLRKYTDSYLAALFSGKFKTPIKTEDGYYFIDRDGTHFRHILNFMRSDTGEFEPWKLTLSLEELEVLEAEAEFYGLADVMNFGGHLRRAEEAALARLGAALIAGVNHNKLDPKEELPILSRALAEARCMAIVVTTMRKPTRNATQCNTGVIHTAAARAATRSAAEIGGSSNVVSALQNVGEGSRIGAAAAATLALGRAEMERQEKSPRLRFSGLSKAAANAQSSGGGGGRGDVKDTTFSSGWGSRSTTSSESETLATGNTITFYLTASERIPLWISAGGSHFLCQTVVQLTDGFGRQGSAAAFWSHCEGTWDEKLMSEYVVETVDDRGGDVHTAVLKQLQKHFKMYGVKCLRCWPADKPLAGKGYRDLRHVAKCDGLGSYTPLITFLSKSAEQEIHIGNDSVYIPTHTRESVALKQMTDRVYRRFLDLSGPGHDQNVKLDIGSHGDISVVDINLKSNGGSPIASSRALVSSSD